MTLNLTATTTEEKVLKEYLEQTVSKVLADKINNGFPVEKDGKKLVSRKTLAGFMKYATDEARKQAAKGATTACLHSDIVFGWLIHYFEEDGILGTLYNEDGTEYKAPKPAPKPKEVATTTDAPAVVSAPVPQKQDSTGQLSLFDFTEEPQIPVNGEEVADEEVEEQPIKVVSDEAATTNYTVNKETGEVIEHTAQEDPYADRELLYQLYLLFDQKIDIVE